MRRHAGAARLRHRRPAGQGGVGSPRPGAQRARIAGHRAAVEADHHQPVARRPAQGGQSFRPADRAGAAGGAGNHSRRCRRNHHRLGRTVSGRDPDPGDRRPARRDVRGRGRQNAVVPQGVGRRGRVGRRLPGDRGAGAGRRCTPLYRAIAPDPGATGRGGAGPDRALPARCEGTGTRQAGAGNRRRRAPSPADDRPAGIGQVGCWPRAFPACCRR